jgi:hypothetical protein
MLNREVGLALKCGGFRSAAPATSAAAKKISGKVSGAYEIGAAAKSPAAPAALAVVAPAQASGLLSPRSLTVATALALPVGIILSGLAGRR